MNFSAYFGTFMDCVAIIKTYGPFLVAVAFFLWRDHRREDRMGARIERLEDEMREVMLPLVERTTAVVAENTAVMRAIKNHFDL